MLKWTIALGLVVSGIIGTEQPEDCWSRERLTIAVRLARQINTAEAAASAPSHQYKELSALQLPAMPDGFRVQLSTDGTAYTFSVKDTLDACHSALFSDQEGVIYIASPIR
jgi:hypothetical protein